MLKKRKFKKKLWTVLVVTGLVLSLAAIPAAASDHPDTHQAGWATALQQISELLLSLFDPGKIVEDSGKTPDSTEPYDKTSEQTDDEPGTGSDDELGGFIEPIG